MNEKAVINGKEYRFIKTITDISTNKIAVLLSVIRRSGKTTLSFPNLHSTNTPLPTKRSNYSNPCSLAEKTSMQSDSIT